MKDELHERLCCPKCKASLRLEGAQRSGAEVQSGYLVCECGNRYPIRNFIPRFVTSDSYARNFSFEWTIHARTQIDTNQSIRSRDAFFEKTGFAEEELRGKWVLDVGAGTGRFADIASRCGANVVGIDLSYAIDVAWQNFADRPNLHFVQADIFRLPFRPGLFHFIYSIGVLHHTPDCKRAFAQLPPLLAPGGTIAIWVYSSDLARPQPVNGNARAQIVDFLRSLGHGCAIKTSGLYRLITTRTNPRLLYTLCHIAVPYWYLMRLPVLGHLFKVLVPMSVEAKPDWRVLDTFDWYSPRYQSKHTFIEVEGWFREANLTNIKPLPNWPVAVQGKKSVSFETQTRNR